jgi:phage repressor protein C with HTH and peptisase S24 domain
MSIKPIDFQVQIPKSTEISRIHSEEILRQQSAQQNLASSNQQAAAENLKKVYSHDKVHSAKINEKQKEKENRKEKKEKEQKSNKDMAENRQLFVEPDSKSTIDIKI